MDEHPTGIQALLQTDGSARRQESRKTEKGEQDGKYVEAHHESGRDQRKEYDANEADVSGRAHVLLGFTRKHEMHKPGKQQPAAHEQNENRPHRCGRFTVIRTLTRRGATPAGPSPAAGCPPATLEPRANTLRASTARRAKPSSVLGPVLFPDMQTAAGPVPPSQTPAGGRSPREGPAPRRPRPVPGQNARA